MNATKESETLSSAVKEHLEVISQVASRGADFEAFLEFIETQAAHDEELWQEYAKPRWTRLRMKLYGGKRVHSRNFSVSLAPSRRTRIKGSK